MPQFRFEATYIVAYTKFTRRSQSRTIAIDESLRKFAKTPTHPSLHLEKLSGTDIWTIRIDKGNRMFFIWSSSGDTAIFFYVGPHDSYRKMK